MLHHPLRLWLAEVLVRRGETAGRQHHRGGFWEENGQRGGSNTPVQVCRVSPVRLAAALPTVASCLKCRQELG